MPRDDKDRKLFSVVQSVQKGEADEDAVSDKVKQLAKKLDKRVVDDFAKSEKERKPYRSESLRSAGGIIREVTRKRR